MHRDFCGGAGFRGETGRGERRERRRRHSRRKERILHTRISDQLSEDIRRVAEDLRVPVSNLVRNVLEEVFSAVEQMSDDVGDLFDEVVEEAEYARERMEEFQARRRARRRRREARDTTAREASEPAQPAEPAAVPETPGASSEAAPDFPEVVAWQPVLLNSRQRCAATGRELAPGEEAHVGLTATGLSGIYLSREAMQERGAADS